LVSATTLIVISTVVQTVVISVTLVIFILQFRSQEKAIKESSYQGLMGRYNDLIQALIEKPHLAKLLISQIPGANPDGVTDEEAQTYGHILLAYGIIEEAYLLYKKKWIDEDTWHQWSAFLQSLSVQPSFRGIHEATAGTFDRGFEDYISKNILKENTGA
jgi:hypothetical protein